MIDHINGNGLDNRKENLRLCNSTQNAANTGLWSTNTSGYKGVRLQKRTGKYEAYIIIKNRPNHLGTFTDAKLAAQAYNNAALNIFGEFAGLNKITGHGD